tara:strand:- start:10749 stop:13058 length:2310 start_codon:yes stop_codon:yes gene_type:complete
MSKIIAIQNSFTSGELDPKLLSRTDLEAYQTGLTTALNVVVLPQGGIKRRPGTKFITELGGSPENGIRLVPFEFNTSDAYLLAFTHNRMAVIKNGVLQTNIAGSGNNYLTTTITSAMLTKMCWTQSADTLIAVQEDMVPKKITRTSDTAWTIADVTFDFNPQYAPSFTIVDTSGSGTLTPSAVSGNITLTASSGSAFTTAHINQYINVIGGNSFGRARIVERTSGTVVKAHVEIPFFNTDAIDNANWELETGYIDTFSSSKGFPRSACFHQGRLYFGGSKSRPSTIFASRINEFFNFNPGEGNADDAFVATLDTNQLNAIVDIISANYLQIFTTGGEFYAPQEFSDPLTPTNFIAKLQSSHGSKESIRVQNVAGGTLYIQRQGKALNEFLYAAGEDAYTSTQISLLSSHLLNTPTDMSIRKATSTDEGDRLAIVNGTDGSIAVYTLLRDQKIVAASKFTTAGTFLNVATVVSDQYVSVLRKKPAQATCTIVVSDYANIAAGSTVVVTKQDGTTFTATAITSGSAGAGQFLVQTNNNTTADNLAACINADAGFAAPNPGAATITVTRADRGADNTTVTTSDATRLTVTQFVNGTTDEYYVELFNENVTVDSAVTGTNASSASVAHLGHFTLKIIGDGVMQADTVAGASSVTFPTATTSTFEVGLDYTVTVKTLPIEPSMQGYASLKGFKKRVLEVNAFLNETQNITINSNTIPIRAFGADNLDVAVPVFTGTKTLHGILGYSLTGQIEIGQSAPLKLHLLGMDYKISTGA